MNNTTKILLGIAVLLNIFFASFAVVLGSGNLFFGAATWFSLMTVAIPLTVIAKKIA